MTELPPAPTISSIRLDGDGSGTLSIKLVETRTYEELVEQKTEGNRKTYVYEQMQARAVNVMRLSSTGILELRIQSHLNRSQYHEDIKRVWSCMDDFFPEAKFSRHSLQKLKERIWKNRDTLEGKIRVSDVRLEDDKGFPITASTPKADSNLAGHAGAVNSIQAFLDAGAHQKSAGVWWVKQENGIPSTDIHILLSGESNEFALTATCTKADYEYVLAQFTRIGL